MRVPFFDLVRQQKSIEGEINQAVAKVFGHGFFRMGEEVVQFERAFARFCGTKYGIGVGSGYDAILLSLRALSIGQGDEVITVPNTFVSTVLPIIALGAKPVLVDVDDFTYQIDPEKIEAAVTRKTKAIIPVHLFGYPAPMDEIKKIAKKNSLFIIEDACQAHGSTINGKKCGSLGNLAAFSFYPSKNIGAAGEAGIVVTDSKVLARKVELMRSIGQKERYKHTVIGYNSHLDSIQAAVLSVKLRYLKRWNGQRRRIAKLYNKLMADLPLSLPPEGNGVVQSYYVYVVRAPKRDELLKFLNKNGVGTTIHYPIPLHLQKALSFLGYKKGDFPVAEKQASMILSLPMFPELTENEVKQVSHFIHKFYQK